MAQTFQRQPHEPANGASIHKKICGQCGQTFLKILFVAPPLPWPLAAGPTRGPSSKQQPATGHAAHQPYRTLQCSTLVGGHVGSVHMTRSLAGLGAFCMM